MVEEVIQTVAQTVGPGARTWDWRDASANITWLFGMRWLPALGSQGEKAIHRNLRQQGIEWAVNHGDTVRLIGVPASSHTAVVNRQSASAAMAFAATHANGTHALCLHVAGVGVWVVASFEGSLISDTDRWFDTLDEAEDCLQALSERHKTLQCQSLTWDPAAPDCRDQQPEFLQTSLLKRARFCRLPSAGLWWLWVLLGVAACAGAGFFVSWHWAGQGEPDVLPERNSGQMPVRPVVRVHRPDSLQELISGWHELPVDPAGWLLQEVACRIEYDKAICRAAYKRRESGAHNEGLKRHEPPRWRFEHESLDRAFFLRTFSLPMQALQPYRRVGELAGLSELQRLSAEVAAIALGSAATVNGPRPASLDSTMGLAGQQGAAEGLALKSRALTVRLALRQADRIHALGLPLRWRQADLALVHGAQIDKSHGYLMLNLQGDWLETPFETHLETPFESH